MASWSKTYGITDEAMPTPMPAASATGRRAPARALQPAERRHDDCRDEHRRGQPVDPPELRATRERWASTM